MMTGSRKRWLLGASAPAVLLLSVTNAWAQEVAEGVMAQDAASSGSTEVAKEGFATAAVEEPEASKDATELNLSAGAQFASGNSRSVAMTGAGNFRARRASNQLTMAVAGNYARSAVEPGEDMETAAANLQGNTRYDRFLAGGLAAFLSLSARNDRFQGLDLRLNVDPGLAYYFIDQASQQLRGEAGYDFQYDFRHGETLRDARLEGIDLERTESRHSMRLFAGYQNSLSEAVSFQTGLEYLQGLQETEYWRLNWDVGLSSSINDALSLAATFSLRYDHEPLPGIEELDTVTALSLVYRLM